MTADNNNLLSGLFAFARNLTADVKKKMSVPFRRVLDAPSLPTSFKEGKDTDGCSPLPIDDVWSGNMKRRGHIPKIIYIGQRKSLSFPDLAAMEAALTNDLSRNCSIPIPPPLPEIEEPPVPPKLHLPEKMQYESFEDMKTELNCKPSLLTTTPQQLNVAPSELNYIKENLRKVTMGEGGKRKPAKGPLPAAYITPFITSGRRMSDSVVRIEDVKHRFQDSPVHSPGSHGKNVYENEEEAEYADALDIQALKINEPWFFPTVDRSSEESLIKTIGLDGTYLVRKSRGLNIWQPFTLTVLYESSLFRLKIRYLHSGEYALGEKKDEEIKFQSVQALVTHYQKIPLILMGAGGGRTLLKYIPNNF